MKYCTAQDMIDRFGEQEIIQRTDKLSTGSIDYLVLEMAITDAQSEIDAYLSNYALPLAVIPAPIKKLAADIARHNLYPEMLVEIVEQRYRDAIAFLKGVAAGKIKLGNEAAATAPTSESGPVMLSEEPSAFGSESFSRW